MIRILIKEFKCILRDKNHLFGLIVFPLIVMPILMTLITKFTSNNSINYIMEKNTYNCIKQSLDEEYLEKNNISLIMQEDINKMIAEKLIKTGKANVVIEKDNDNYILYYEPSIRSSIDAMNKIKLALLEKNTNIALEKGIKNVFNIKEIYFNSSANVASLIASSLLPMLVLIILITNISLGLDISVGEKERNTLSSLLVSKVNRINIVLAKSLSITILGLISSAFVVIGILLAYIIQTMRSPNTIATAIISFNLEQLFFAFLIIVSVSILISSIIMFISVFAKNIKHAQIYTSPIGFILLGLSAVSISEMQMYSYSYYIPIVNASLSLKNIFLNDFDVLNQILPTIVIHLFLSIILIVITSILYKNTELLLKP